MPKSKTYTSSRNLTETFEKISLADASEDSDVKRGNANVDGNSAMGKMLQFGAESAKIFAQEHVMSPEFALAHDNGDIHIHDMDFYPTGTLTCCQSDPFILFEKGFNTGHGFLRTPNSITSYGALAAILLQANQNEQHGGQSIPTLTMRWPRASTNHSARPSNETSRDIMTSLAPTLTLLVKKAWNMVIITD